MLRQRAGVAGHDAAAAQETHDGGGVGSSGSIVDVGKTPQLDGGGQAGIGDCLAGMALLQRAPDHGAGMVEGKAAAGAVLEQREGAAEIGMEIGGLRPQGGIDKEMQQGALGTVQVEHDVGITGEAEQGGLEQRTLARHAQAGQGLGHGLAHDRDIGAGVAAQPLAHSLVDRVGKIGHGAVEVDAAVEVVAPQVMALDTLGKAHRVGEGHQHDLAGDIGIREPGEQVVGNQQGRRLAGMDRGLDIGLRPLAPAEAVHQQFALRARQGTIQRDALDAMAHDPDSWNRSPAMAQKYWPWRVKRWLRRA